MQEEYAAKGKKGTGKKGKKKFKRYHSFRSSSKSRSGWSPTPKGVPKGFSPPQQPPFGAGTPKGTSIGSRSPGRPSPGTCDICGSDLHWKAQCPLNGLKGKKGFGKKSGKGPKGGVFGGKMGTLWFIFCILNIIQIFVYGGYSQIAPIQYSSEDEIFPYDFLWSNYDRASQCPSDNSYWSAITRLRPDDDTCPKGFDAFRGRSKIMNTISAAARKLFFETFVFASVPVGWDDDWCESMSHILFEKYEGFALLLETGASSNLPGSVNV